MSTGLNIESSILSTTLVNWDYRATTSSTGKYYILVISSVTGGSDIIASSTIIEYDAVRKTTYIKTAGNHFDISGLIVKNAPDEATNNSYDVFTPLSIGGTVYNVYYSVSLGYGQGGNAYTTSDIRYITLNNGQYQEYLRLMNEEGKTSLEALDGAQGIVGNSTENYYVFAYLGTGVNRMLASHIISINTSTGHGILI